MAALVVGVLVVDDARCRDGFDIVLSAACVRAARGEAVVTVGAVARLTGRATALR